MDSPIWFDTINLGWFIVYVKGSQVIISKLRCILVSEGFFSPCQTVQILMKCLIVWHFIWIFTVCQSTCSGVSSVQRVDKGCHETIIVLINILNYFLLCEHNYHMGALIAHSVACLTLTSWIPLPSRFKTR